MAAGLAAVAAGLILVDVCRVAFPEIKFCLKSDNFFYISLIASRQKLIYKMLCKNFRKRETTDLRKGKIKYFFVISIALHVKRP